MSRGQTAISARTLGTIYPRAVCLLRSEASWREVDSCRGNRRVSQARRCRRQTVSADEAQSSEGAGLGDCVGDDRGRYDVTDRDGP
jgi:hypothetical protein